MPIYEYQCEKCGKRFEIFQKINAEPLTHCKVCNGSLHKLISQCSFHLKGSGWYVTDYKKPIDSVKGEKKKDAKEKSQSIQETVTSEPAKESTETAKTKESS